MSPEKLTGKLAKKAAKKIAGKAAKKGAGKKGAKTPAHEMRRGYEHLHRVHALAGSLSGEALEQVQTLALYAQAAFRLQKPKAAADLLRASEHFCFASLGSADADSSVCDEVRAELKEELEHLLDRAGTDWESQDPARSLRSLYKAARTGAKQAWRAKTYGRALEFARAADAIAHAKADTLRLEKGATQEVPQLAEMIGS